jgi:hypothetical protein
MLAIFSSSGSYAKDLVLVAILGAATLVGAASPRTHRCHHHQPIIVVTKTVITYEGRPVSDGQFANPDGEQVSAQAVADGYYQRREFSLAAQTLRASHDPSLEANAQLYDQLARAWDRAFAKDAPAEIRFEALRYARRLDLAFGGTFAGELDANLRELAPLAARAYAHDRNSEGLELALTTCDALGVVVDHKF